MGELLRPKLAVEARLWPWLHTENDRDFNDNGCLNLIKHKMTMIVIIRRRKIIIIIIR